MYLKKITSALCFTLCLILVFILISCTDSQTKKEIAHHQNTTSFNQYVIENKKSQEEKFKKYFDSLSLEEKISQIFIENLEGVTKFRSYETIGAVTGKKDDRPLVAGGYLFFSYNIADNINSQIEFNNSIKSYCHQYGFIPPYLAVDQEGGYVNRLRKLTSKLPSNEDVRKNYDVGGAFELYKNQAKQMKALGFNMNLAPVIEVCTLDNSDFLDGRSYGSLDDVINYGRACINAYENQGIATVVKHFPGNTNTDPHTGLPKITLSQSDLEESLKSFKELLKYNPTAILMSHAVTSAIDPEHPACLSKVWVTDILRNTWHYEGLIMSDDIFMAALADNGYPQEKAALMAIEAGIDCIMISEKRFAKPASVLYKKCLQDDDFKLKIEKASQRVLLYKVKAGILKVE